MKMGLSDCECRTCRYAWWPKGEPVDDAVGGRTIDNGGLGQCRESPPVVMNWSHCEWPLIGPDDWCGGYWKKDEL